MSRPRKFAKPGDRCGAHPPLATVNTRSIRSVEQRDLGLGRIFGSAAQAWVQESLLPCTLQQLIPSSCHDENKAVTWKLTTHQHCDFAKLKGYQFKFFLLVSNICMVNFVILCVVTCDLTLLFEFWYSNYLGYLSTQKFSISIRSICVFCKLSEINLTHLLFILYR